VNWQLQTGSYKLAVTNWQLQTALGIQVDT